MGDGRVGGMALRTSRGSWYARNYKGRWGRHTDTHTQVDEIIKLFTFLNLLELQFATIWNLNRTWIIIRS